MEPGPVPFSVLRGEPAVELRDLALDGLPHPAGFGLALGKALGYALDPGTVVNRCPPMPQNDWNSLIKRITKARYRAYWPYLTLMLVFYALGVLLDKALDGVREQTYVSATAAILAGLAFILKLIVDWVRAKHEEEGEHAMESVAEDAIDEHLGLPKQEPEPEWWNPPKKVEKPPHWP